MENVPFYVNLTFLAVVITTFAFFFYALISAAPERKNFTPTVVATFMAVWLFIVAILTFYDFLEDTTSIPPRLFIFVLPAFLLLIGLFAFPKVRAFFMKMPLTTLTYLHIIRVPVEIVLWWLSQEKMIPVEMTFEGSNYDILSGISAPFAGVFLVGMKSKSKFGAVIWNVLALALVINVVAIAIRAMPYFHDPAVFAVPNQAVLHFPFVWLPTFVVPVVVAAHIISLYKLAFTESEDL
ncbi:MAG: hypothetical protein KI790_07140 [Cyclobacteriaceae bacterium]|nr:hypothetical protein [Cyclobacteriaceae bacterium HetDA_MAG_MS6]